MKIPLILLALVVFGVKGYCQLNKSIYRIDSNANSIKSKHNLASKTIKDTTQLTYSNGTPVMEHYYNMKCEFEKGKPEQLVRVIKEKTVYYYNLNDLIKVQDNTDTPMTSYFWNRWLISSNVPRKNTAFYSKYHLIYAKRFVEKFLAKS